MERVRIDDVILNASLSKKIPGALGTEAWQTTDYTSDTYGAILLWRRACELYPKQMIAAQTARFKSQTEKPFEIEFLFKAPMPARFLCEELYRILIEEETDETG